MLLRSNHFNIHYFLWRADPPKKCSLVSAALPHPDKLLPNQLIQSPKDSQIDYKFFTDLGPNNFHHNAAAGQILLMILGEAPVQVLKFDGRWRVIIYSEGLISVALATTTTIKLSLNHLVLGYPANALTRPTHQLTVGTTRTPRHSLGKKKRVNCSFAQK